MYRGAHVFFKLLIILIYDFVLDDFITYRKPHLDCNVPKSTKYQKVEKIEVDAMFSNPTNKKKVSWKKEIEGKKMFILSEAIKKGAERERDKN